MKAFKPLDSHLRDVGQRASDRNDARENVDGLQVGQEVLNLEQTRKKSLLSSETIKPADKTMLEIKVKV